MLTNRQLYEFLRFDNSKVATMTAMKPIEDATEGMQAMHREQMQQVEMLSNIAVLALAFLPLRCCASVCCLLSTIEYFLRNSISISA